MTRAIRRQHPHWRTCPAEWRLLLTPPIPLTDDTEMGTR